MNHNDRVIALRRHELARVIATFDDGAGWSMMTASRYTAHAIFRYGQATTGHVIGTVDGWWWGVQTEPRQTPPVTRCNDLREACVAAQTAARRRVHRKDSRARQQKGS